MSDYPHVSTGGTDTVWTWQCRCGATPTEYTAETARGPWGVDCPAAMREEITALRAQVEALKAETNIKTDPTMHDHLHTTDIRVGGIYTNGDGLFRRVTGTARTGSWVDVVYSAYRRRSDWRMVRATVRGRHVGQTAGISSFTAWARREATETEATEVLGV